jgi:DNA-binding MarR family transcriptional regulator
MVSPNPSLQAFIDMARIQAVLSRRFDARLGGLGFTEFVILHHLHAAKDGKMRRIDLADKAGLTASGITRLLAPMEKIGLLKREANAQDARVSLVVLTPSGKRMLQEAMEDAELIAETAISSAGVRKIDELAQALGKISGTVR